MHFKEIGGCILLHSKRQTFFFLIKPSRLKPHFTRQTFEDTAILGQNCSQQGKPLKVLAFSAKAAVDKSSFFLIKAFLGQNCCPHGKPQKELPFSAKLAVHKANLRKNYLLWPMLRHIPSSLCHGQFEKKKKKRCRMF